MFKTKQLIIGIAFILGSTMLSVGCKSPIPKINVLDTGKYWDSALGKCAEPGSGCVHGYIITENGSREEYHKGEEAPAVSKIIK